MATRRIHLDIREVQVESDENPIFGRARRKQLWIGRTCKPFGKGGLYIVPETAQRRLDPSRKILIQLEAKRR